MNEEIKHFKAILRQGALRHMNIILDEKFQKELLNIIKDYEDLQRENQNQKNEINCLIDQIEFLEQQYEDLKMRIKGGYE